MPIPHLLAVMSRSLTKLPKPAPLCSMRPPWVLSAFALILAGCGKEPVPAPPETPPAPEGATAETAPAEQLATFGGGCFWCTEAVMERLEGVSDVRSGYMGGHLENPTYEQVCRKDTGHVEVIQLSYDPDKITYDELLDVFWQAHDPTTLDRQGEDRGPQYRSVIFTHTPDQKNRAELSKRALDDSGKLSGPVVTEIREASTFWLAEENHQDFYRNNPNFGYCRAVISPKMKKMGFE
ncbi:MAG: peptide-methionine (S)-S-oxide reductase MsrA [Verrucomicrobiae bacterium]|nr:peptide-methionine (S)-S-oxide reductase MsrA [Verrucomicrobiae bacterium]